MLLAVCDDDNDQLIELKNKCEHSLCVLKATSPITIHTYRYGEDLILAHKSNLQVKYDIIIMDIEFGQNAMNGLETTRSLREMGVTAPVIISTSHDTYLRQGYGLEIIRYIIKPIMQDDLNEALTACIKRLNLLEGKEILLKSELKNIVIRYKDIIYFECGDHFITAHSRDNNKYSCYKTIEFIEKEVPPYFLKIHKGIIVNFNYVTCIKGSDLTIDDGTILSIAQRRRSECMGFFRKYVRENI